jgi:hypothetical protein
MDPWDVPPDVHHLANREAWRLAGHGVGMLARDLEPADCQRVSEDSYECVAEIPAAADHPAYRVDITIARPAGGEPTVTSAQLRPTT